MKTFNILPIALGLLIPFAAQAHTPVKPKSSINEDVRQSLADAREEVRAELAKASQELESKNLRVDKGIQIGKQGSRYSGAAIAELAPAEITPQGDFLIDGRPQDIDANQRAQLLAYRYMVVEIAKTGIDIGQRASEAVFKEVDGHWLGLFFSALTGSLERRVERTVKQEVEPGVRGICRLLPRVMDSQQRLVSNLPKFQPYARLEQKDIDGCEDEVRSAFASL